MDREERLHGGNATEAVVRVDETVRKPWTAATPLVHEFMADLRGRGVDLPRAFGSDEQGRQMLEFVPGADALGESLSLGDLARVGGLVRQLHDAAESFAPTAPGEWDVLIPAPGGGDLICHNDLAPWNLVIGERWVFIDWDGAGPSTRLWDLSYAAVAFALNDPARDALVSAEHLAAFIDGYGADTALREALPEALGDRAAAMLAHLERSHAEGREPWASMFTSGHGRHWYAVTAYVRERRMVWKQALER